MLSQWRKVKKSGNFKRQLKKNVAEAIENASRSGNMPPSIEIRRQSVEISANQVQPMVYYESTVVSVDGSLPSNSNYEVIEDHPRFRERCEEEEVQDNWLNELEESPNESSFQFSVPVHEQTRSEMRNWAIQCQISHSSLKSMFPILNKLVPNLFPLDPRTFLGTPRQVTLLPMGNNAQYWHQGLSFCLKRNFQWIKEATSISLNINIDGLKPYKSSTLEFWPILCNVTEFPNLEPMVIGIYSGEGKPTDPVPHLTPLVEELKDIMSDGICINGIVLSVSVRAIICDSPARAYVKGCANFNSQVGCNKCTTQGEWSKISHSNIFPLTHCAKRTDAGFRSKQYGAYYKKPTPLLDLNIDMVEQFPVSDELHLLHLGVMKRLLTGWRDGSFVYYDTKWTNLAIQEVNSHLDKVKMPAEIHRAVRNLNYLGNWKGLEYRTFLHYISIVVLKDALTIEVYEHFLLFFLAATIWSSEKYTFLVPLAEMFIDHFVELYGDIYGVDHINSNVHNLVHVCDEVRQFGILSTFSAYPFESQLFKIKNLIRTGNCPLAQVCKRIAEQTHLNGWDGIIPEVKYPRLERKETEYPELHTYKRIILKDFLLDSAFCNKWFLTTDKRIVALILAVDAIQHGLRLYGSALIAPYSDFFTVPVESSHFNIYFSKLNLGPPAMFRVEEIKSKMIPIPYKGGFVFIPLIHTL